MAHNPRIAGKIKNKLPGLVKKNFDKLLTATSKPTLTHSLIIYIAIVGIHFSMWAINLYFSKETCSSLLQHWDAGWYLQIVTKGYDSTRSAFPPLFPYLIRVLTIPSKLDTSSAIVWFGTIFSTVSFIVSLVLLRQLKYLQNFKIGLGGYLLIILSPASYIFHSFHTESLFLLLSLAGFYSLHYKKWWLAAMWAGLAALTRHQGVLLAISLALGGMLMEPRPKRRIAIFFGMGSMSALIWGFGPLLHYSEGRGWFPAFAAHQDHWFLADGVSSYFKTLIMANPIQNFRLGSFLHQVFYFLLIAGTVLVFKRGKHTEGIYCFLSLAIMPLQGELVDAFRFGAVLFPIFLAWGEFWNRQTNLVRWSSLIGYIGLNLIVTWQYGLNRWSY